MSDIELAVGPQVGQVQTDTFCEGCGYNLLTQAVMRDDRLGILVCRCPECGRYAAAGRTTSADRVWLNRLGAVTLVGWVFFLLTLFSLLALFIGMLTYGQTAEATELAPLNPMNQMVQRYVYAYKVRDISPGDEDSLSRHRVSQVLILGTAGLLSLGAGMLFSSFFWHVRGWRRGLAVLPPLLGAGVAILMWMEDPMTRFIRAWGARRMCLCLLFEILAVAIGVLIGRPVARGLLRILVPPRARQHLAFLWITDGKVPKT